METEGNILQAAKMLGIPSSDANIN
ncbi:hypothetical protein ACT7DH_10415 [Bacillus pacificus]